MGEVEEFNTLTFEKRLMQLKDTQESIQALSSWCLRQREHHKKIVASWLNVLKRVKVEQRLVLFYLANDVIQYSKRKNLEFVESWGLYLQKATPLVRDEKVRHKILRIFKIWEQRAVYDDEFLSDLTGLLSAGAIKKTDDDPLDFQPQQLVNKIKQCTVLEADTDLRLKYIHESHLELSDADALCANLKDRSNKDDVEKELNEGIQCVERYTQALQREIVAREALLALLSTANQYYSTQRGEVKVVAYAYKNFGARVRALKRKLDELIPMLPSKVPSPPPREEDVPSPEPDEDLDLPLEDITGDDIAYNIDRTFNTTITADGSMYNLGLSSFLSSDNPMAIFNESDTSSVAYRLYNAVAYNIDQTFNTTITADGSMYSLGLSSFLSSDNPMAMFNESDTSSANKIEVIGSRNTEKQPDFDINNFLKTLATGDSNPATSDNSNSGGVKAGDTLPGLDLLTDGPHSHPPPPLSFYGSLNTHNDEPEVYHPEMTTRNQWSNQWSNPPAPVPPPMIPPPSMPIPVSIASNNQSHLPNNQSHLPNNQSHPSNNESYPSSNESYPSNTQTYTSNNQSYPSNTLSYTSNTLSYTSNNQSLPLINQSPPRNNQLHPPNNQLLPPNNQLLPPNNQLISPNNQLIPSNNQLIPPSNKSLPIIDAFEPPSLPMPGSPIRTISPINPTLNSLSRARFDTPESPPPVPPPPPAPIVPVFTHNAELPPADVDHRGILPPPPPPPVLPLLGNLEDVDHRLLPPPPPAPVPPAAGAFPPLYDMEDVDHRPQLPPAPRHTAPHQDVDHRNLISLTSQPAVTPVPHMLSGDQDYRVPPPRLPGPSDIVESVDMDLSEDEDQQALFQGEHRRNSFNNNKVLVGGDNNKKKHNENHNLRPIRPDTTREKEKERPQTAPVIPPMTNPFDNMPVGLKNMNIQFSKSFPSYPREDDRKEDFTKDENFENANDAYEDDLRSRGIDEPQEHSEKFVEWQQRLFNNHRFPRNWGPRTNFRPPMPPQMWPRNMQRPMNRWMGPRPRFW